MTAIWVFVALCAIMAGVFIRQHYVGTPLSKLLTKGAASLLFVMVGFLCARVPVARPAGYAALMLLGLCLGMAGDLALACQELFPQKKNQWFLAGIVLFAAGHIAYTALFFYVANPGWIQALATVCAAGLGLWLFRHWRLQLGAMTIPGYAYLGIIALMFGSATGFFAQAPDARGAMVWIAAILFYTSDAILAHMEFAPKQLHPLPAWNLVTYYAAQLLLALSIGIA